MTNKRNPLKVISIILITAVISSGITFFAANRVYNSDNKYYLSFNKEEVAKSDVDKFSSVWEKLQNNFYYEVDEKKMFEGAIAGLAHGLNDPYTVYYTKEQMKLLREYSSSSYVGIGIIANENDDGILEVVEPVKDGPAYTAGFKKGDLIVKVDGKDITMEDTDLVIGKIKGKEGTEVTVTVYRPDEYRYIDFNLTRRKIHLPSVESKVINNNIGYVRISMFDTQVAKDFYNMLNELIRKEKIQGLVIDLRDNPGGSYDQVVSIADMLLPEAVVLYTEDKKGNREYEKSNPSYIDVPLVVLVNGHSASASEVLAGALQDNKRASIIGTQTFGKGVVQVLLPLEDGSGLKVTISSYFTPDGNKVHGVGITPDRVVSPQEEYEDYPITYIPKGQDYQLNSAIEVLKGKMAD